METTVQLIAHILTILKQLAVVMEVRNLRTLAAMIALLMKGKRARLYELARALPGGGKLESRAQKLRRWLSNVHIEASSFLPIYLNLLAPVLTTQKSITLIIDRTSWTRLGVHLTLFLCSIAFHGRSFPIFWFFLPKRGASNLEEQKTLLSPVLTALANHPLLAALPVIVDADREFCSPLLAQWFVPWGVHFDIRVKKNFSVSREDFPSVPISRFLDQCERGRYYFYENVRLTEAHQTRVNLLIYWRPDCDEPIALISDLEEDVAVAETYHQRPWIETLNRDLKSGGFDVENGKITDSERIDRLLIAVAFAYILLLILGYAEEVNSPVNELKKGRKSELFPEKKTLRGRTYSLFSQARNRITDLLERTALQNVHQFFEHFFDFLMNLLNQQAADKVNKLFKTYARRQCLLLKGFQSSVRY
jgi:hypothetical protein